MSKKWVEEDKRHILYFTPFYEEENIAEVFEDEGWCCDSELLELKDEYLYMDTLEDAKLVVEIMIETYFEEQIGYYQELLKSFNVYYAK